MGRSIQLKDNVIDYDAGYNEHICIETKDLSVALAT